MCLSWQAFAAHYIKHRCGSFSTTERDTVCEYLSRHGTGVSQSSKHGHRSSATYLGHNHRKGENICFLAIRSLIQHLWRSPLCGVAKLTRGLPHGIQVLSDRSDAEICDIWIAEVVYENVRLAGGQYGGEMSPG